MISYDLPEEITIGDTSYPINKKGDYRMILDVISALNDETLSEYEKTYCALGIFYDFNIPHDTQKAADEMMMFINCGEVDESAEKKPPVMSWEQDFKLLAAPINKALGYEIRAVPYLHWWTFIGGYMEIGECQFSNIVSIRNKKRKGVRLDKGEQEFYNENRAKVDLKVKFDNEEQDFFDSILGGKEK
jgi:hypothetical protein